MAKIYSSPIKTPKFSFETFRADEERYMSDLKKWVEKNVKKGKYVGDIVNFPIADGYASYMITSLKPANLIHIPLGDAYEIPAAHARGLTAKDLKAYIEMDKTLNASFEKKVN